MTVQPVHGRSLVQRVRKKIVRGATSETKVFPCLEVRLFPRRRKGKGYHFSDVLVLSNVSRRESRGPVGTETGTVTVGGRRGDRVESQRERLKSEDNVVLIEGFWRTRSFRGCRGFTRVEVLVQCASIRGVYTGISVVIMSVVGFPPSVVTGSRLLTYLWYTR